MKVHRLMLVMFMLLIFSVHGTVARAYEYTYKQVIEIPGKSKQQIFEQSKQWIAKAFVSAKKVIEYESLQEGKIIGNSSVALIDSYRTIFGVEMVKGEYLARFSMTEDIKEGKLRITIDQVRVQNGYGVERGENLYDNQWKEIEPKLIALIKNLTEHLNKSVSDNW